MREDGLRRPYDGLRRPWGAIVAFLLPALTIYVAFTAYPVVRTFWNSLHKVLPRRELFQNVRTTG